MMWHFDSTAIGLNPYLNLSLTTGYSAETVAIFFFTQIYIDIYEVFLFSVSVCSVLGVRDTFNSRLGFVCGSLPVGGIGSVVLTLVTTGCWVLGLFLCGILTNVRSN